MAITVVPNASANTGAGGLTILYASIQNGAHQCNVISNDSTWQAVVCSDLLTYEGATSYYAYGRTEAYCQTASTPHTTVACQKVTDLDTLQAGDGTAQAATKGYCAAGTSSACSSGRNYLNSGVWSYKIANAGNGVCSSNAGSSYVLWNLAWQDYELNGYDTAITTPDGQRWLLGEEEPANDGLNESSGHYLICP